MRTIPIPGVYNIRSSFFRNDWDNDSYTLRNDPDITELDVRTLLITKREEYIYPWTKRSKYIVRAEAVLTVGVHEVLKLIDYSRFLSVNVDEDVALVHHYRPTMWENETPLPQKMDRRMHAFRADIVERIGNRNKHIARLLKSKGKL